MMKSFEKNGPELMSTVKAKNKKLMDNHYITMKAYDDDEMSQSSDMYPNKISKVAYYNSLPFSPSGSCYR